MNAASRRGFTLVELLVGISIVAILATLMVGAFKKSMVTAKTSECLGKMKALGIASRLYISENNGGLPFTSENTNWMINLAPYLGINGVLKKNEPFTKAFLCPDDLSRSPRQLRSYRYNSAALSTSTTQSQLPKNISGVSKPASLGMLFCTSFTGPRQLELWTYDTAIWREDVDNNNPPDKPGVYPRPHFGGSAINILYYDGHAASTRYPLSPITFHFDGK